MKSFLSLRVLFEIQGFPLVCFRPKAVIYILVIVLLGRPA